MNYNTAFCLVCGVRTVPIGAYSARPLQDSRPRRTSPHRSEDGEVRGPGSDGALLPGLHVHAFDERALEDEGEVLDGLQDADEGVDGHAVPQEGALFVHPGDGRALGQQRDPLGEQAVPGPKHKQPERGWLPRGRAQRAGARTPGRRGAGGAPGSAGRTLRSRSWLFPGGEAAGADSAA